MVRAQPSPEHSEYPQRPTSSLAAALGQAAVPESLDEATAWPVDAMFDAPGAVTEDVHDDYGGRVMRLSKFLRDGPLERYKEYAGSAGVRSILESVGYVFKNERVYMPSTERFLAATQQHGVPVELVGEVSSDTVSDIPGKTYAAVVKRGKHPVSGVDLRDYEHDTAADHLLAVAVGRQELMELVLQTCPDHLRPYDVWVASHYDAVTTGISGMISHILGVNTHWTFMDYSVEDMIYGYAEQNMRGLPADEAAEALQLIIFNGLERLGIEPTLTPGMPRASRIWDRQNGHSG